MNSRHPANSAILSAVAVTLSLPLFLYGQTKPKQDVWEPLKFFVGKWEGTGNGKSGTSKVERDYRFVFNNKFLQVQSRSVYEPQQKKPKGEIHEESGMISFDKARKQYVCRQFHVEGFVIQYVSTSSDDQTIVFTSESIENIPAGWRARETYKIVSPDEFVEVFELAEPEKDFVVYTENRLRRMK
jgi:hypothetical protein